MGFLVFCLIVCAFGCGISMFIMFSEGEKLKGTICIVLVLVFSGLAIPVNSKRLSDNAEEKVKYSLEECDNHAECFVRTIKQVCYNTSKGSDCKDLKTTVKNIDKKAEKQ